MPIINLVYEAPREWKPWSNTLAYYKFDWNLNDSSWNSRNFTSNWTVSYWTETWWGKYIYFNSWAYTNNLSIPYKSDWYTISLCGKYVSWNKYLLDFQPSTSASQWNRFQYLSSTSLYIGWGSWITVPNMSNWYNMVIVNTGNKSKLYMNWEYKWYADLASWDTTSQYFRLNSVWYTNSNYWNYAWPNYMWRLIVENKWWTEDEIVNDFNNIKSLYWIS